MEVSSSFCPLWLREKLLTTLTNTWQDIPDKEEMLSLRLSRWCLATTEKVWFLLRTVFWPALNKSPGFLWSRQHEWRSASVPLKPFKCGGGPLPVISGLKTFLGIFHHLSNSLGGQKIKTLTALLSNPLKPLTGAVHTAQHAIREKAPQTLEKYRRARIFFFLKRHKINRSILDYLNFDISECFKDSKIWKCSQKIQESMLKQPSWIAVI